MYDVIIIGGGPAGMTAGIYAARKKLKTLILTKDLGGQMAFSGAVENYSGFSLVEGPTLVLKFRQHLESVKEDLEIKEAKEVIGIEKNITSFQVQDRSGELYYAKSLIIASGRIPKRLDVPGEEKFYGRGVTVCATCDAPLYKNKNVAVIGGGNSAMDALLSLAKVANRIYSINLLPELVGDEILKNRVLRQPNITFFSLAKTLAILGKEFVDGVKILDRNQQEQTLSVAGVFVEIGYIPSTDFDHLTKKNDQGEIMVDQNLQTSVPGIFAAGDVNDAWGEQMIIAAGEGAKAAMAVANYLNRLK